MVIDDHRLRLFPSGCWRHKPGYWLPPSGYLLKLRAWRLWHGKGLRHAALLSHPIPLQTMWRRELLQYPIPYAELVETTLELPVIIRAHDLD